MLGKKWAGVAYGLATWLVFELSVAPVLGLEQTKKIRPIERLMFAGDHIPLGGHPMNRDLCTVGRDETLCQAAGRMLDHGIGAAIIESSKPKFPCAIISDRDVLATIGAGQDTEVERIGEHLSRKMTFSALGLVPQPGSRGNE